ncbi:MAG: methyltransferase domain-containing protein [Candidatus Lindowbacteria bacterium]|nr:methyltransferase domain-containing protein [Candidatus Lindowbacteria bacterium]
MKSDNPFDSAASLNYKDVSHYWSNANPSILGPYMMDGFGFPASAGQYRFCGESEIVQRLIDDADYAGTALDLGSGAGHWTEYFAQRFTKVVAVEASSPLFEAMTQRCSTYTNVSFIHGNVLSFEPEGQYSLIFLGGMLMYLNKCDVIALLQKVTPLLVQGGVIVCRESTVRNETVVREGDYQVVYRSVQTYRGIFNKCDLSVDHVEMNVPYILMQMGCEFIKKWKMKVPSSLQAIPIVGHVTYWALRLTRPWITRLPATIGVAFPELTNHFFVLRKGFSDR